MDVEADEYEQMSESDTAHVPSTPPQSCQQIKMSE